MSAEADIASYEGLIFSTAVRYDDYLDDDLEDIQQILRVKVWRALLAFDPQRSRLDKKNYVFGCVRNQVKDLLKAQARRDRARNGRQLYIEDAEAKIPGAFEVRYLAEDAEAVFAVVEDERVPLPATLTELERGVVLLLLLDFNQTEMAVHLQVSRRRVRHAHLSVQEKMRDWRPGKGPVRVEAPTEVAA
jgi:RNA polymerase sigma factor (sigma-70 family)